MSQPGKSESQESPTAKEPTGSSPQTAESASPEAVEAATPTPESGDDSSSLQAELESLRQQLQSAEEKVLRVVAEEQNTVRRAQQDVERARKFALESFVKELLPVVDNLERALESLEALEDKTQSVVEGVELTYKGLLNVLERFDVRALDPLGESFNPELHQAMSLVTSDSAEPNSVLQVFQKGYTLNGRLVRPAMVVVSKA